MQPLRRTHDEVGEPFSVPVFQSSSVFAVQELLETESGELPEQAKPSQNWLVIRTLHHRDCFSFLLVLQRVP
jgi:hypothetical protein